MDVELKRDAWSLSELKVLQPVTGGTTRGPDTPSRDPVAKEVMDAALGSNLLYPTDRTLIPDTLAVVDSIDVLKPESPCLSRLKVFKPGTCGTTRGPDTPSADAVAKEVFNPPLGSNLP
mmetsp:Transcript_57936/g.104065  ORF Transcript_57936/g.104065 Transcript_57936/m.104065 type:complete len:119 (-) Transcript_57936:25-381(-)|eukprot:CAMPEP_0115120740 /NCGR_PEP_ID=MMETSP0227-20121206/45861_1 /TAXON_ID=89957 /ORGANISM="Polarella glacialis, Strain CCMP 1383" /LENGTH=118 /DNA_ID=CAMNT_0002522447 /DNA_START=166 /DNA_END=522 /DNA_ORIENTATION=-